MGEFKTKDNGPLPQTEWNLRRNQDVRALLDHVAHIIAKEYVEFTINTQQKKRTGE